MPRTVSVSPDGLPDITATLEDDGTYDVTITGLTGLDETPRALTKAEKEAGIVAANPPRVRTKELRNVDLLLLRAIEVGLPEELLENFVGGGAVDREQLLLGQICRTVDRVMWELEPPS